MEIDSMDEIISLGHKEPRVSMIMKGKRTKRPRQPSPASAVFTASSCSSDGGGGGGRGGGRMHSKIRSSESLCSEISTTTEEDEDMANCLILLAQSGRQNLIKTTIQAKNDVEKQEEGDELMKLDKYSSRKLKEMTIKASSTIVGKANIYVYECKTCNRCFPSFQALGGHRTSHKKHKPMEEMEETKQNILDDHHQEQIGNKFLKISPSSLLSLEIAKKNSHGCSISKAKIHECSICGAEFASGQALGGHMRRHRSLASATTITTGSSPDNGGERPRNVIELDLNLPAPPEDVHHHHDSRFRLSLYSSHALVDC